MYRKYMSFMELCGVLFVIQVKHRPLKGFDSLQDSCANSDADAPWPVSDAPGARFLSESGVQFQEQLFSPSKASLT